MTTLTIDQAQANLSHVIDQLQPGEEVAITRGDQIIARLVAPSVPKGKPIYGRGKGRFMLDANDKSHLVDFAEYMP